MVSSWLYTDHLRLLTHWGRVTHIGVGNLTIIGPDNGLSPGRCQAIIWTNAGILSIGPLGTNFNEISIGIQTFSFKKMHFKMSSAKWRPICLGLYVLNLPTLYLWGPVMQWVEYVANSVHEFSVILIFDIFVVEQATEEELCHWFKIQYIPRNMHTVLLCFALLWLCNRS